MDIEIREFKTADVRQMQAIWNEVVESGDAFPQLEILKDDACSFFTSQTFTAVAENRDNGEILGLYILHPNNIGRCGHLSNASFAVSAKARGHHIGEALVRHCLEAAKRCGFKILQFNAVVKTNIAARKLYEKLGFVALGTVPGGFMRKDGTYEDIVLYYHTL